MACQAQIKNSMARVGRLEGLHEVDVITVLTFTFKTVHPLAMIRTFTAPGKSNAASWDCFSHARLGGSSELLFNSQYSSICICKIHI